MKILVLILMLLSGLFATVQVRAFEFIISGNGTGSNNSALFDFINDTSVNQSNSGSVNNNVDANANTGGNSGSATTGDANVDVNITNNLNSNNANVNQCCPTPTVTPRPTNQPTNPTATPTSVPGVNPTSTPASLPSNGGNGGGRSVGGAPVQGEVLGLAATSGAQSVEYLFYTTGVLCLVLAKKLLRSKKFVN